MVRRSSRDARVHVAVADGKVQVTTERVAAAPSTLTAGSIYDATDSTVRTTSVDEIAPSTEWVQGQLVFHHTPVATVLRAMSQWYGYHFRYTDSTLSQRPVTVGLSVQSSAEALATLEQLLGVNVTVAGDTVTLAPQPGRRVRPGTSRMRGYDVWTPTREVGR
jgi:ferric-dicitrate binding protein FerR (iron transport regulator)